MIILEKMDPNNNCLATRLKSYCKNIGDQENMWCYKMTELKRTPCEIFTCSNIGQSFYNYPISHTTSFLFIRKILMIWLTCVVLNWRCILHFSNFLFVPQFLLVHFSSWCPLLLTTIKVMCYHVFLFVLMIQSDMVKIIS